MTRLLTPAQMQETEKAAIAAGAVTGAGMMERAGQGVVDAMLHRLPALSARPRIATVLCGPGNNGGDGYVIARLLRARGWKVRVHALGDVERLPPDAGANARRWREGGGEIAPFESAPAQDPTPSVVIDAVFGTGLTRPLDAAIKGPLSRAARGAAAVVAVDMPSGLCGRTGRDMGAAVRADLTVTFHRAKTGHYLDRGPWFCGALEVVDIGLGAAVPPGPAAAIRLARPPQSGLDKAGRHKFDHGHAVVLSGGAGRTGAARLAARAALRVGAGLVTLGVPPQAAPEVAAQITAVMMRPVAGRGDLDAMLADARIGAICLGPGMGTDAAAAELVEAALAAGRPTVLDADALTILGRRPDLLHGAVHDSCVLTPHGGEFARMFPDLAATLTGEVEARAPGKIEATRAAARAIGSGATLLFKGADTVIADGGNDVVLGGAAYERAAPWLATAGSGDVLAGLITGLLARGLAPMQAAEAGVWIHTECALGFGPGLIAEDLSEQVPRVLRAI